MSHRLQHLHKKRIEPAETQSEQGPSPSSLPPSNTHGPATHSKNHKPAAPARPIFPPTNTIQPYNKKDYLKGEPVFPPPESLYAARDTEIDPRFVRSSCSVLSGAVQKTSFPFSVWITPFASEQVSVVQVSAPLRCHRCKGYVNPYFQFDGTRKVATCNLCGLRFGVEQSVDRANLSSTEIATQSIIDFRVSDKFYFKKRTDVVKVIALVELSMPMMELGVYGSVCDGLRSVFESHEFDESIRVGVAFYCDQGVGFVRGGEEGEEPNVFMVPQGKGTIGCCPLSETEFYINPNTARDKLVQMIDFLQKYAESTWKKGRFTHTSSYTFALRCMRDSFDQQTGKILLFSLLDPRSGPCSIRARNEEQSKTVLKPLHLQAYEYAKELLRARIGVDHFIFSKDSLASHELATMHFLSSSTGGKLQYYNGFNVQAHGTHLYYSIFHALTRACQYDVDFTCRTSNGINVVRYGAPDGLRESRDVGLSVLDSSSSFTVQLEQEEKLEEHLGAFIQFAAMYTTSTGQRRIRVINYKFEVSNAPGALYASIDYLTLASVVLRSYSAKLIRGADPNKSREDAIAFMGALIGEARARSNVSNGVIGDINVPAGMVWSFCYLSSVLNSRLFLSSNKLAPDARIVEYLRLQQLNPYFFASRYYPRLYPLTLAIYEVEEGSPMPGDFIEEEEGVERDEDETKIAVLPANLPLCRSTIKENEVYLVDNGEELVIIVMQQADEDLLLQLFGTTEYGEIEAGGLPELQTSHNIRVNNIVNELRRRSASNGGMYQPLSVRTPFKKGPFNEYVSLTLKEDNSDCGYTQFIEQVQRAVVLPK